MARGINIVECSKKWDYMLIVVEGIDGSGKSFVCDELSKDADTVVIRSSSPPFAPRIRKIMNDEIEKYSTFHFMYYLLGNELLKSTAEEYLKKGKKVVFDRYIYSTKVSHIIFDKLYNSGANLEQIERLAEELENDMPVPDLVILLRIDPIERMERMKRREENTDKIDKDEDLMKLFDKGLLEEMERLKAKGITVVIIDNSRTKEETMDAVRSAIRLVHVRNPFEDLMRRAEVNSSNIILK